MKNGNFPKKKVILSVCLLAGALLAVVGGTLAIYTSQAFQRSVVRNRDNEAIRFSSDKLYRVAPGTDPQKYYYPMSKDQKTMTFQVCNYDQAKNTKYNEKTIAYKIEFWVKNRTENGSYTISDGSQTKDVENGASVFFEDRLPGRKKSAKSYTFTFSEDADYNKVELYVTVTPKDLTTTQNRVLNGILIPIEYATTQGVTLKWEFMDSTRGTPDKFDAYNLSVSVSGGSGNVLITWDNTVLDIDPFFSIGKTVTTNGNQSTITVPMDSDDETGAYLISFYNHNAVKPGWTTWSELPIFVELETSTGGQE